jgi:replicative DNA helicase Mcm
MMKGTGKNKRHEFFLKGNNLEREDRKYEDLEIGDEEKEEIINLSKTPDLYKKVIGSIAPRIEGKGMGEVKRAIALQLFGGVPELEGDGVLVPGDINILLIGDPGIGKTHIIKHISGNLAPRGIYTTGAGSSGVGLTASVIKKSDYGGEYRVEAGPMVLGDKGIVCIDEFDKMPPEERGKIHEALSNQTVTIAKAGVNITFNSRCTVLGGANPKGDRIDIGKSIKEQIDLPSSIIDRFDLLYILQDIVDEEEDWKVASSSVDKDYREESNKNKIPQDMLRKYIAYARTNIEPELNDEAKESIKKYYVTTRGNREDNDPIPITPRFLNTLKKLSQARARMELRETVTSEDVEEGVDIVKNCLETVGMDPITGRMDIDRAEGRTPAIEKDLRKIIKNIVEEYELDRRSDYSWFNNEETREEAIETIIEQSRVIDRPDTREKLEEKLREEISFRVSGVREEEEEE